jgi:hypothetical protein
MKTQKQEQQKLKENQIGVVEMQQENEFII